MVKWLRRLTCNRLVTVCSGSSHTQVFHYYIPIFTFLSKFPLYLSLIQMKDSSKRLHFTLTTFVGGRKRLAFLFDS